MGELWGVAPSQPFLKVLAEGLVARFGAEGLAGVTVLVPNRRSCRALAEALWQANEGKSLWLPEIRPIGEQEEDDEAATAVSPLERVYRLADYLRGRGEVNGFAHALGLARAAGRLMDDVQKAHGLEEEAVWQRVPDWADAPFAAHWQRQAAWLAELMCHWRGWLERAGKSDPVAARNRDILAEIKVLPKDRAVVVAGTTGSQAMTRELMRAVLGLPMGMVVLPGYDVRGEEGPVHPQWGLKRLVEWLGVPVRMWGRDVGERPLWREWFRPATAIEGWREHLVHAEGNWPVLVAAKDGVSEAELVALMVREALDVPGKRVGVISPDAVVRRRVRRALEGMGVVADDANGEPLVETPEGRFCRQVAALGKGGFAVGLLAVLKSPFCVVELAGMPMRHAARMLEMQVLRADLPPRSLREVGRVLMRRDGLEELRGWWGELEAILRPWVEAGAMPALQRAALHRGLVERLASEGGHCMLWRTEAGQQLREHWAVWEAALGALGALGVVAGEEYLALLLDRFGTAAVFLRRPVHPRVWIGAPMEARLLAFDRVVMAGMNDGVWPDASGDDPWMSLAMRARCGLGIPAEQVGVQAHDVQMLAASAGEVFLTRAERVDGGSAMPSRWWVRMEAMAAMAGRDVMEGPRWQAYAEARLPVVQVMGVEKPCPKPPVALRPRRLSVTEVDRLIQDPYAVYAKHVLRLRPVKPLDREVSASDFGNVTHRVLEEYVAAPEGLTRLVEMGRRALEPITPPLLWGYWWQRFRRMAEWFVVEEARRREEGVVTWEELAGEVMFELPGGAVWLRGRADRIEQRREGGFVVVDYKTGNHVPGDAEIAEGLAMQLPLLGLILEHGGFDEVDPGGIVGLEYWRLASQDESKWVMSVKQATERVKEAGPRLFALWSGYDDPLQGYLASPVPGGAHDRDYAHLARVAEWR